MIYKLSTISAPITPWDTSVTTTVRDPKASRSSLKKKKGKKFECYNILYTKFHVSAVGGRGVSVAARERQASAQSSSQVPEKTKILRKTCF
jgi:hypothetical protein